LNLRDLHYLVALEKHRHFGKAAEACFVSQPTLSTQIKKLEEQLDVQLVERSARGVILTHAGMAITDRARAVLIEVDAIREISKLARAPEAGELTLGVFPTLAPYWLPHVVPRLLQRFPKLDLRLVEEKTETLQEQLLSGQLDVAVMAKPIGDERLHSADLFVEDFLLAVPRMHPLAAQRAVSLQDLEPHRLLLLSEGHCLREQALAVCTQSGSHEFEGFRATSLETLRQMVAAGVGATLLPKLATIPPIASNSAITLLPFTAPAPSRTLALYWRKSAARGGLFEKLVPLLGAVPQTQ
jgi:LysR family transcriptional regulator, hydrogen peroxide-inducible genes activator